MSRYRWSLRTVLVLITAAALVFGYDAYVDRRVKQAVDAFNTASALGMDAHFPSVGVQNATITFKNANVTDADLEAFLPFFNGYAPRGAPQVVRIRLNGSPVSAEALEQFRTSVPCRVDP